MQLSSLPALNANIIVIAILVGMGGYGLLAGKQRLRILILSIYVGIVLADQLTDIVRPTLGMLSPEQVSWLLFGVPILIFGFVGVLQHGKHHDRGASVANIIVGFLTGALIVSSGLHMLPTSQMAAIDGESFIAMNLQQFHLYILGGLPIVALLLGFVKGERHH
jgi:hypothetical protein